MLPAHPKWRWDEWTADYCLVCELIAETCAQEFHDFNARMFEAGGFYRGNPAHERTWKTASGKTEMNALIPLWYHDEASNTPASKGVPVHICR